MSKEMARLYEKAWNKIVNELPGWKKEIIINNFPYEDDGHRRIADDIANQAVNLAEEWEAKEQQLSGKY